MTSPAASKQGRVNRRRGYDSEKVAEKAFGPYGFTRIPLSGAQASDPGDLIRKRSSLDGKVLSLMENKRRTGAWNGFEQWLPPADFLRLDPGGRRRPWVAMPQETFLKLLDEAGYRIEEGHVGG